MAFNPRHSRRTFALVVLALAATACAPRDPAGAFIARMDQAPHSQQPPNWPEVKRLMARRAPAVGEAALDFTLATPDGGQRITRSAFHEGRPLVLIFGSFT